MAVEPSPGLKALLDRAFEGDAGALSSLAGQRLGRYRIIRRIGSGASGLVLLAEDEALRRPVALKVLPSRESLDPERRVRFLQEARTAARLSHPHVATIHAVEEHDDIPFVAMEFVEGSTLRERLRAGRVSVAEAELLARGIASGLARAHESGIVHRDMKPENVLLDRDGRPKVADFGLAKSVALHSLAGEAATASGAFTLPGAILGTPRYMSPEQIAGEPVDPRSDVFSFGVLLYEMLAGAPPFDAPNFVDLAAAIRSHPYRPLPASVPARLVRIVERCLAKSPNARYATAADLVAALAESGDPERLPRRRGRAIVAAIGALSLVVAVGLLSRDRRAPSLRYLPVVSSDTRVQSAFERAAVSWYAADGSAAARALEDALVLAPDEPLLQLLWAHTTDEFVSDLSGLRQAAAREPGSEAEFVTAIADLWEQAQGAPRTQQATRDFLATGHGRPDRFFLRLLAADSLIPGRDPETLASLLTELDALAAIDPAVPLIHKRRGFLLSAEGRLEEAERAYLEGLRASPASLELQKGLAATMASRNRHAEAREVLSRVLDRTPNDPAARSLLANVLLNLDDENGRAREVEALLAVPSLSGELGVHMGMHAERLFARGRRTEAVRLLDRIASDKDKTLARRGKEMRVLWALLISDDAELNAIAAMPADTDLGIDAFLAMKTGVRTPDAVLKELSTLPAQGQVDSWLLPFLRSSALEADGRVPEALRELEAVGDRTGLRALFARQRLAELLLRQGDSVRVDAELQAIAASREECIAINIRKELLCRVVVARALATLTALSRAKGDEASARRYSERLAVHWPDADPDLVAWLTRSR